MPPKIREESSPSKEGKSAVVSFIPDSENISLNTGNCIHEIFENISWIDDGSDTDYLVDNISLKKYFADKIMTESKLKVKTALKNAEIRRILSCPESPNVTLWREKEFSLFIDGTLKKGRFDRVTIEKNAGNNIFKVSILDFKYEELVDIDIIKERYSPQMNAYKDALACILKISAKNIETKLLLINRIAIL